MNWMLTILTFLPLVGVLAIILLKQPEDGSKDDSIKLVAIAASAVTFLVSLFVLFRFDATNPALQLVDRVDWIPSWGISYFMGVDGLSILMVLLTTFISLLAIIGSWTGITTQLKQYYNPMIKITNIVALLMLAVLAH